MVAMILSYAAILALYAAVVTATPQALEERAVCNRDNCLRALVAPNKAADASADCNSYLRVTVTPCPVTTYSTTAVVTVTTTRPVGKRAIEAGVLEARNPAPQCEPATTSATSIPPYAVNACKAGDNVASRYSSACSCNLLTSVAPTTAATPTVTLDATTSTTTVYRPTCTDFKITAPDYKAGAYLDYLPSDSKSVALVSKASNLARTYYLGSDGTIKSRASSYTLLISSEGTATDAGLVLDLDYSSKAAVLKCALGTTLYQGGTAPITCTLQTTDGSGIATTLQECSPSNQLFLYTEKFDTGCTIVNQPLTAVAACDP